MDPARASMTALGTAVMRAAHTRLDRPALIDDPWGEQLVSESERAVLEEAAMRGLSPEARARLDSLGSQEQVGVMAALARAHPSYGTVILRMRFAEDVLSVAVARGVRQYVIIWARGSTASRCAGRRSLMALRCSRSTIRNPPRDSSASG